MKFIQIISNTTGWNALYKMKTNNFGDAKVSAPLLGWGLTENGNVIALVPADDGTAVPAADYSGKDGELTFDSLGCGCDHEEGEE